MTRGSPKEWRAAIHAALLAGAATVALPAAARPTSAAAFAPPSESPLLLSRKVVREISGGTAIVATRRYRVTFHENGDGWVIRGDLVASEIDAPPALAAIAAIERNRPDEGLFPIYLDSSGLIVPAPAPPDMGREAVAAAVDLARQGGGDASATASGFIGKVAAAARSPGGGLTRWPEDLFRPDGMHGTSEQAFTLPDGNVGKVQVSLESDPVPGQTVMRRAARTVVTMTAESRRVAREEWTLWSEAPLGKP